MQGLSLCPLLIFKYLGFFSSTAASALALLSVPVQPVTLRLLQPVGISFYTFQIVSYEADVYRGRVKAERHPGIYALFVCFFKIMSLSAEDPEMPSTAASSSSRGCIFSILVSAFSFGKLAISAASSLIDAAVSNADVCRLL